MLAVPGAGPEPTRNVFGVLIHLDILVICYSKCINGGEWRTRSSTCRSLVMDSKKGGEAVFT